jgi:hypothetical protein
VEELARQRDRPQRDPEELAPAPSPVAEAAGKRRQRLQSEAGAEQPYTGDNSDLAG